METAIHYARSQRPLTAEIFTPRNPLIPKGETQSTDPDKTAFLTAGSLEKSQREKSNAAMKYSSRFRLKSLICEALQGSVREDIDWSHAARL